MSSSCLIKGFSNGEKLYPKCRKHKSAVWICGGLKLGAIPAGGISVTCGRICYLKPVDGYGRVSRCGIPKLHPLKLLRTPLGTILEPKNGF